MRSPDWHDLTKGATLAASNPARVNLELPDPQSKTFARVDDTDVFGFHPVSEEAWSNSRLPGE